VIGHALGRICGLPSRHGLRQTAAVTEKTVVVTDFTPKLGRRNESPYRRCFPRPGRRGQLRDHDTDNDARTRRERQPRQFVLS
jgi:hypothetical protein